MVAKYMHKESVMAQQTGMTRAAKVAKRKVKKAAGREAAAMKKLENQVADLVKAGS